MLPPLVKILKYLCVGQATGRQTDRHMLIIIIPVHRHLRM